MRTFLAIQCSALCENVEKIISDLCGCRAKIKWTRPDQVHMTLHFFGDLTEQEIEVVKKCCHTVVSRHTPLRLTADTLGVFPSLHNPRVIWLGFLGDVARMETLVHDLENEFSLHGFGTEKRAFKPHVTLGRVKAFNHDTDLAQSVEKYRLTTQMGLSVEKITLYRSTLLSQGPEYSVLKEFVLHDRT